MDKYVVQNGDGDEDDFATLPEAIEYADKILADYREDADGGEWNDYAEHVRVLEVLAIAKPTYGSDDEGEEFVDYTMDAASECDPEISRLAGLVAAATKRADDAEREARHYKSMCDEARKAGRQEAAMLFMQKVSAELVSDGMEKCVYWSSNGEAGDHSGYWEPKAVMELFEVDAEGPLYDLYDKHEGVCMDLEILKDEHKETEGILDKTERERDAALAVLTKHQWSQSWDGEHWCLECGGLSDKGHTTDCALVACLNGGAKMEGAEG